MILRKEDKTMKYNAPEIAVLGEAIQVIQQVGLKIGDQQDGSQANLDPAYDLDE
jgi:hypothetical protein